ncbi:hypothetical protein WNZ14_22275 [Hoeflea sp. AS60]|uniref:hypothetical protein n=1 Tax=Hoeflea sp. AS60 TaxID=3135780 RepID=UPI0031806174
MAVALLIDAWRRYAGVSEPLGARLIVMSLVAAAVYLACVWLLGRLKEPDVSIEETNTFGLNDFASYGGILIAGGLDWWLGSNWPGLVVGVAAWGGIGIVRYAHEEHHEAVHGDEA